MSPLSGWANVHRAEHGNSFAEEVVTKSDNGKNQWRSETSSRQAQPHKLSEITSASETRIVTPDNELNRVLGG